MRLVQYHSDMCYVMNKIRAILYLKILKTLILCFLKHFDILPFVFKFMTHLKTIPIFPLFLYGIDT